MKNSEVKNEHKNKDGNIKTILFRCYFKWKIFAYREFIKNKARICAHEEMQQWGVNYRDTNDPVVNWISVRLELAISSIHILPSITIDFVLEFT